MNKTNTFVDELMFMLVNIWDIVLIKIMCIKNTANENFDIKLIIL